MKETDLINLIIKDFPKSTCQLNRAFTSDAEILNLAGQQWAFTIDEFSPEEDLFINDDPEVLGANLVIATLSDLFATGAKPNFFMQSLSLPKDTDQNFIQKISTGIRKILNSVDCKLIGGDIGIAETWRYTGVAFGQIIDNKPLTRILPDNREQILWVTGSVGDANLAALMRQQTPQFECRYHEADIIHQHATACIDTSGGLLDAIWTLSQLNPLVNIAVDLDHIPYASGLVQFSKASAIPMETALLGGAGEYELLFATPATSAAEIQKAKIATPIGKISSKEPSSIQLIKQNKLITMSEAPVCPRSTKNLDEYIQLIIKQAKALFG